MSTTKTVCDTQTDFNRAFRNAIKYNSNQNMKQAQPWIWVYMALYFIFIVWALILSLNVPPGPSRTLHILFAMFTGPAYVLSHYLNIIKR